MGFRQKDIDEANENRLNEDEWDKKNPFKMQDRECTDCYCCFIYIVTVFACIGITGYAYATGNPKNMLTSYDNNGRMCGDSSI